jgi:hypothetical protein
VSTTPPRTPNPLVPIASNVLIGALVLAAFTGAMLYVSGAAPTMRVAIGLLYGGIVVVASGLMLVMWVLGQTPVPRLAVSIVVGSLATSLVLVGGYFLTGQRAGVLFVWWSAVVAATAWPAFRRLSSSATTDLYEGVSIVAIGLLVAFWCRPTAALLPTIHATGVAPAWTDYFIHGAEIAQFGDRLATGRSTFALADQPIGFYHFASYMLPAAVSSLVEMPALALASSVLFPFGILLLSLGSYILARTLGGRLAGLLVPFALLLVPDASTHGLQNGFFSFHWFLGASPGSAHALGAGFTALTFLALWRETGRRACLWMAVFVTLTLFQVRALLFLLFAPAFLLTLLCDTDFVRRRARPLILTIALAIVTVSIAVAVIPPVRDAWLRFTAMRKFLEIVHTAQTPSAYDGVYRSIEQRHGLPSAQALGFVALIPCVLGGLTIVWPAAVTIAIRRTGWRPLDSFPIWCLVGWLALVLIAPPAAYGDAITYQYHAFVLVYATAPVWTLLMLHRVISTTQLQWTWVRPMVATLVVAGLGVTAAYSRTENPVKPRLSWGWQLYGTAVDRGLLDAANFVRVHAVPGDTFALIPVDPSAHLADAAIRFAALANVPAYLSRPAIHVIRPQLRATVEHRVAQLRELESTTDPTLAFAQLRRMGITFFVVLGPQGPYFDPQKARADFQTTGAAVYRIAPR